MYPAPNLLGQMYSGSPLLFKKGDTKIVKCNDPVHHQEGGAVEAVLIAGLGIAGTLLSPLIAERARRKSTRQEQLTGRRLAVYADLLRITARVVENAQTWSAIPTVDLQENDPEELDHVVGQADVIASPEVDEVLREFSRLAHAFHRDLVVAARPHHQSVRREGRSADDATAIQKRSDLGRIADQLLERRNELPTK